MQWLRSKNAIADNFTKPLKITKTHGVLAIEWVKTHGHTNQHSADGPGLSATPTGPLSLTAALT